jgi:hypothetical protein
VKCDRHVLAQTNLELLWRFVLVEQRLRLYRLLKSIQKLLLEPVDLPDVSKKRADVRAREEEIVLFLAQRLQVSLHQVREVPHVRVLSVDELGNHLAHLFGVSQGLGGSLKLTESLRDVL